MPYVLCVLQESVLQPLDFRFDSFSLFFIKIEFSNGVKKCFVCMYVYSMYSMYVYVLYMCRCTCIHVRI